MKKVWMPKGELNKVSMAEAIPTDPARLAVNLLMVFFCKEELGSGNCTPSPGRDSYSILPLSKAFDVSN